MNRLRWMPLMACLLLPWTGFGQQRPLKTDDAEILETGRVRLGFGVEFLQGQRYSLSGLRGDLIRLGVSSIHVGVGEYAEIQISGVAQDLLSVSERSEPVIPATFSGNSTSDFGDLILGTKIKFAREKGARPAIAFKFAVELPNAKHDSGLGTNETEFYSSLLFKKHFGRSQIMADLGFAILGSPVLQGRQTDPFTYGVAAIVPLHRAVSMYVDFSGRQGPPRRVGNENKSQVRAGIQFQTGKVRWDVGGVAGLMRYDAKSGILVGMTYEFQGFKRGASKVRIQ
ncbi:MAG: transporter [Acidobacteriota bacterium]|nr:transporter [Acidobacteriota bacterium]